MRTIKSVLTHTVDTRGDHVVLRHKDKREWKTLSYSELLTRVKQVSEILNQLRVKTDDRVAIHLPNCAEWPEIYFAITSFGATAVPIDAKLREKEIAHIVRDSEASVVFASDKTYQLIREVAHQVPRLKHVVLIGAAQIAPEPVRDVEFFDYAELMAAGAETAASEKAAFDLHEPQETQMASIIYTSGTTGRQKGAVLTHRNFCSSLDSCLASIDVREDDNFMLVLPLHHAFAFMANLLVPVGAGCEISLVQSLKTVGENVREVSPTVLVGVPLLCEKMYARIITKLKANKAAYLLYRMGFRKRIKHKIREGLGGRLRLFVVGGAPSSPDVLQGFRDLGIPTIEGYGLTETAPVLTLNPIDRPKRGSVGPAIANVELKIINPNADGYGEIAGRGPNIMQGYFGNPQATADTFEGDWFLTGDLGYLDDEGYLFITGRKKSLIVNREGKNIYPEEVENAISGCPFVLESLVLGHTTPGEIGEKVAVIVVPDQDAVDAHLKRTNESLGDDELIDFVKRHVREAARSLADYKRPRHIQIRLEEFEKTSTGKVKRYLYEIANNDED